MQAAANVPAGISIPFANKQELLRTRANIYAYINALEVQEEANQISFDLRLSPAYRQIRLMADKATNSLLLQNRRFSGESMAIESVLSGLGLSDEPANTTPIEMPSVDVDAEQEDLIHNLFRKK